MTKKELEALVAKLQAQVTVPKATDKAPAKATSALVDWQARLDASGADAHKIAESASAGLDDLAKAAVRGVFGKWAATRGAEGVIQRTFTSADIGLTLGRGYEFSDALLDKLESQGLVAQRWVKGFSGKRICRVLPGNGEAREKQQRGPSFRQMAGL